MIAFAFLVDYLDSQFGNFLYNNDWGNLETYMITLGSLIIVIALMMEENSKIILNQEG